MSEWEGRDNKGNSSLSEMERRKFFLGFCWDCLEWYESFLVVLSSILLEIISWDFWRSVRSLGSSKKVRNSSVWSCCLVDLVEKGCSWDSEFDSSLIVSWSSPRSLILCPREASLWPNLTNKTRAASAGLT